MSYFAVALARTGTTWAGDEIDLDDVEDLDGLVDVATAASPDAASPILVAVEENDEWLALLRIDGDGDTRVFLSDCRVLETSDVAAIFADALATDDTRGADDDDDEDDVDDDEDDTGVVLDAEPGGDSALLSDLGTTSTQLLALCAQEGALPGDITAAVCERAGCGEVYDSLRTA